MGPCKSKPKTTTTTTTNVATGQVVQPAVQTTNTNVLNPIAVAAKGVEDELRLFNMGKHYENLGDFPKAIQCFNLASRSNPASSMPYTGLGNCYFKMGDPARSIQQFNRAIRADPNNKYAYNGLGVTYENIHRDKQAVQNFNKAIQIDRNFSFPYNGLGNLFYVRGNYNGAVPYYQSALNLEPSNPLYLANLACSQMKLGRTEQAFQILRTAVSTTQQQNTSPSQKFMIAQRMTQFQNALRSVDANRVEQFKRIAIH